MGSPKIAGRVDSENVARLALAGQFVPAGARVLELDADSLTRYLPFGCAHRSVKADALTADEAAKSDIVALLDGLQSLARAENLLRRLARAGRPLLISYRDDTDNASGFYDLVAAIDRCGLRIEAS